MIGMPSLPIRKNHHARTHLADYACHFKPILPGIFDAAIGNIESAPPACAENPCCIGGLAGAILCRAACAQLALRQIENAGPLTALRHLQQRATAGLLYIVTVCGNGENVEGRRWHVSQDCLVPERHSRAR